jgi:uncharacterized integral membrane protein
MPWRLVGFIVLFGIFLVFITLNLQNVCDVSFGFTKVEDVPVYLTSFCAFALGLLCIIPFAVSLRLKKHKGGKDPLPPGGKSKKTGGKKSEAMLEAIPEISPYRDDGTYGID